MRMRRILVGLLVAGCAVALSVAALQSSQAIAGAQENGGKTRALRLIKTPEEDLDAEEEERGITDPVILENLAKFDDWISQSKTAQDIYKELGLKLSWKIAYRTGRWQQFLFNEPEYLLYRKYVKYLKLIGRGEN
jgi:hypothetical protein